MVTCLMKDCKLEILDDKILAFGIHPTKSYEVMMEWERPLMERHADVICQNGGHILEIGYGMGISSDRILSHDIESYTIVESHPDIIKFMKKKLSKYDKDITIIEGDWYEMRHEISKKKYDGIMFDTFRDNHYYDFPVECSNWVKEGSLITFWLTNAVIRPDKEHEFEKYNEKFSNVTYEKINLNGILKDNRYFSGDFYYLPLVKI